ncbi:MAG TPA: CoA transferase [Methylomirabilota bacterium]|jgi:crotonobetainyl-CoA:carnitine CoA-transferase CaiB-like acyl-CoA transferase|nr:CoA transferase [Methylomirabilota bacterium]
MPGILDGIRVFDLTIAAVGPWASKLLGEMGADVIKVEAPEGELSHVIPPPIKGTAVLYISANFNKRNIVLDLKHEGDRAIALKIIEKSDVFIQNMRPGAVERLGLGYEVVSQINPKIVYVSASAYGRTGPMAKEAGIDPNLQALCGWCSITGQPDGQGEMFRHLAHLDITTSTVIVEAVLQALLARERTGKGQKIEIEMLAGALSLQTNRLAEYFATGEQPRPMGSATSTTVPHQAFLCQDQQYLAVGVVREEQWPRFCRAVKLEELSNDPRFATNPKRVENRAQLIPLLEERFRTKPAAWWVIRLTKEQVPNSRLLNFEALRHHPQVLQNEHIVELQTPHWGALMVDGLPWKFSKAPAGPIRPGGLKGEHTAEVLREFGAVSEKSGT